MWKFNPDKLRELRQARGWTLKDAEKAIGTSSQLISLWELGKRIPSTTSLAKLCNVFNAVPGYFFIFDAQQVMSESERAA